MAPLIRELPTEHPHGAGCRAVHPVRLPLRGWSVAAPAVLGASCILALVLVAGRTARVPGATPPSSWLGLLGPVNPPPASAALGGIEVVAVLLLVLSWWSLLRASRRLSARAVTVVGLLWAAPLAFGPPVLSLDAYSYLAQGRVAALGLNPYHQSPAVLADGSWLQGVDPFWRDALSPYGPLAVLIERGLALTGSPVAGLLLLHALALTALVVLATVVHALLPVAHRTTVLMLVVVNPLVLLQLLGAAHWEALLVALLAACLLAWHRQHPAVAVALASSAAAVKLPAAFAVAVLLVLLAVAAPRPRRLQSVASGLVVAATPWVLLSLVVPDSLGFTGALSTPLTGRTLYAPTTLLAEGLARVAALAGVPAHFDVLLGGCRAGGLVLALVVCCGLLATASRRPAGVTIGAGLLTVALLGPVLYPWYCTWGLLPLALTSLRHRRLLVLLSTAVTFTALPGCVRLGLALLHLGPLLGMLAVAGLGAVVLAVHRRPLLLQPPTHAELNGHGQDVHPLEPVALATR